MKNTLLTIAACVILCGLYSCETDNYVAPGATIQGQIADPNGDRVQLEQGSSTRIRLEELSWSDNPIPIYLNVKQDGSYINSKIFAGNYRMLPIDGAFYPLTPANDAQTVEVKEVTTVDFTVVPYLNVAWVSEPAVTTDNKITATFRFTRSAAPAGLPQPNLLDYQLFISTTQYVGNNNYDATLVTAVKPATNAMENQDVTIVSNAPMKYATKFFIRVGVRVNDSFRKYNYTDIKTVEVP